MFKRLALVALSGLVAASVAIPAASAQDDNYFVLTVDKTAYTNQFKTGLTVTGTYSCLVDFEINQEFSGLGVDVSQIQGKGMIVTGGNGTGGFTCDGETYPWSVTDVWANFGYEPATWKNGRATARVGAGIGGFEEGQGAGADVNRVIQIR